MLTPNRKRRILIERGINHPQQKPNSSRQSREKWTCTMNAPTKKPAMLRVSLGEDVAKISMTAEQANAVSEISADIRALNLQKVSIKIQVLNDSLAVNGSSFRIPLTDTFRDAKGKYFSEVGRIKKVRTFTPTPEAIATLAA